MLIKVLGAEFDGVLGCDYFSAYRRYLHEFDVSLQFCLAHLIRDVKFLTTLPDARDRMYGTRLREALRELFGVIHRRELLTAERFQTQLEAARVNVLRCGTQNVPATNHCRNLAKRFEEHGESYSDSSRPREWSHQQSGRASDPVRGDRSFDHAGYKE